MERCIKGEPSVDGICGRKSTSITAHGEIKLKNPKCQWVFSRQEIDNSPSRKDGIDGELETCLRRSYSGFIQDLGMSLQASHECIATAIVLCHRFFHVQSHAKNDAYLIATTCMHLAGKVEKWHLPLQMVISTSTDILRKKSRLYWERMKHKEYSQEQVLLAQWVILGNLGFDIEVQHPYKLIIAAIKKYGIAQYALAELAWNLVNDGLRTSLFLQFKNYQIAAGVIFLAAKFLKVKLPVAWWKSFTVVPCELEEISSQLLELYEKQRNVVASCGTESGNSGAKNCDKQYISNCKSKESPKAHLEKVVEEQKTKRSHEGIISNTDNKFEKRRKCSSSDAEQVREMAQGNGHDDQKEEGELSDYNEENCVSSPRPSNHNEITPIKRHDYYDNYRRRNIYSRHGQSPNRNWRRPFHGDREWYNQKRTPHDNRR